MFIRRLYRSIFIWHTFFSLIFLLWWDGQSFTYLRTYDEKTKSSRQRLRASWLKARILRLGSAFIKLGQLLSARPDLLPKGWIDELSSLQDQVPSFSFNKAQEIIQRELGQRCKEIIDINDKPLGAASLAQVHKATLRSGRQVVLKIQRPGLENVFKLDLEIMQKVAGLIQKNKDWSQGKDWVAIAQECKKVLMLELDFRIEAQYAARFRQQFFDYSKIKVPGVIWELTTEKIICLDYIPGIKINDTNAIKAKGLDPSQIAEIGAESYLKQLIEFGFFHADPHPGNLAVSEDGSLIYYDFGMMGMLSERIRKRIGSMVKSAALRDTNTLIKQLQEAGLIALDIELGPVRRLVRMMLKEALTPPFKPNALDKISGDLYELVYEKPFRLPVELIFVMRALSTFEGVGRTLDPSFNLVSIAKPYLIPLMTSNNTNPNDIFNEISRQVGQLGSKAVTLPKRLDENLERLEDGDLQIQVRLGESDRQFRRIVNAQHSISQSILLGSLGISTALLGSSKQPILALVPIILSLPIGIGWINLQAKIKKDSRIEKMKSNNR